MNWEDITVEQFQQLNAIDKEFDALDKTYQTVSIIKNIDLEELDVMALEKFNQLSNDCTFVVKAPLQDVTVKRYGRFKFVPDIRKIKSGVARYIEIKHFSTDYIPNMHYILASMVQPQKKNWLGLWVNVPYESKEFEQYALELQQIPITVAMGWLGFFLRVSEQLKKDLVVSSRKMMEKKRKNLVLKMMWKHKMPKKEVEQLVNPLWENMAGYTK
jgi:hypothetical protein